MNLYDIYGTSGDLRFQISADLIWDPRRSDPWLFKRSGWGAESQTWRTWFPKLRSPCWQLLKSRKPQIASENAAKAAPLPYLSSLYVQIWKYVYTCVYSTSYMTHILYIPAIFQVVAGKQSVATSMGEPSSVSVLNNSSRRRYRKYARSWSDISDSPWVGGKDIKDLTEGPYEDLMISRM